MDRERFNRKLTAILRTARQHTRNSHAYLAASYAQLDRVAEAKAEVEEILTRIFHEIFSHNKFM